MAALHSFRLRVAALTLPADRQATAPADRFHFGLRLQALCGRARCSCPIGLRGSLPPLVSMRSGPMDCAATAAALMRLRALNDVLAMLRWPFGSRAPPSVPDSTTRMVERALLCLDRMTAAYRGRRRRGSRRSDNFVTVRGGAANGATALNLSYLCLAKWVPYLEGPVEQRARQASEAKGRSAKPSSRDVRSRRTPSYEAIHPIRKGIERRRRIPTERLSRSLPRSHRQSRISRRSIRRLQELGQVSLSFAGRR